MRVSVPTACSPNVPAPVRSLPLRRYTHTWPANVPCALRVPPRGARCALETRRTIQGLLGRPASESGTLCHGDRTRRPPPEDGNVGYPDWATKRRKSMKRGTTMLSALAVIWALALPSWAQVKELPTTTETISGTIETIDKGKRAMNIKTADGKFVAVNVPKSVIRFDQFKVGDKVKAT